MTSVLPRKAAAKGLACDVALVTAQKDLLGPDEFRSLVHATAGLLGSSGEVINLCEDRLRFLVLFAAAMMRGRTVLLPPSRAPAVAELGARTRVARSSTTISPFGGRRLPSPGELHRATSSPRSATPPVRPAGRRRTQKRSAALRDNGAECGHPARRAGATGKDRAALDRRDRAAAAHVRPRDLRIAAASGRASASTAQAACCLQMSRPPWPRSRAARPRQHAGSPARARRFRCRLSRVAVIVSATAPLSASSQPGSKTAWRHR